MRQESATLLLLAMVSGCVGPSLNPDASLKFDESTGDLSLTSSGAYAGFGLQVTWNVHQLSSCAFEWGISGRFPHSGIGVLLLFHADGVPVSAVAVGSHGPVIQVGSHRPYADAFKSLRTGLEGGYWLYERQVPGNLSLFAVELGAKETLTFQIIANLVEPRPQLSGNPLLSDSVRIKSKCDPGAEPSVGVATETLLTSAHNFDEAIDLGWHHVAWTHGAAIKRTMPASVEWASFVSSSPVVFSRGSLTIQHPDGIASWDIQPGILFQGRGSAGEYRVSLERQNVGVSPLQAETMVLSIAAWVPKATGVPLDEMFASL